MSNIFFFVFITRFCLKTCNKHVFLIITNTFFWFIYPQSGTALAPWAFQDSTVGRGFASRLGELLGCSIANSSTLRKCLQDASAEELYNASTKVRLGKYNRIT